MAVTTTAPAPYAPPTTVLEVITRHRGGVPGPYNAATLGRIGVSDSLIPRTLQALQTLDLITAEGVPTETMEGLRRAPEADFQPRLAAWLNEAYADVLNFVDPAAADDIAIRDAFREYNPVGQQPRMVTLFTGLYTAAGVRNAGEKKPATPRASPIKARKLTTPVPKAKAGVQKVRDAAQSQAELPPALAGLMATLPHTGDGWTQATRDKFVALFGMTLDFCVPIVTQADIDNRNAADL